MNPLRPILVEAEVIPITMGNADHPLSHTLVGATTWHALLFELQVRRL